ncbi:MAG: hypothetical protein FWD93_02800, partial [Coriobacteriia bacterium]|nr:hypothetical protein [Coriobacteriia bacterium]
LERKELLDPFALKQLERYNERRLSAFEMRQTQMVLAVFSTLLADVLRITCIRDARDANMTALEAVSLTTVKDGIINIDALDDLLQLTQSYKITPGAVAYGQDCIAQARKRLARNVNVELLCEALLFDLREVLRCHE